MSEKNLSQIVAEINEQLRAHGKNAVHEVKMMNREGKTIGQIRYGYRPQYVFDAINEVLLPENWRYEVATKEIYTQQAVVEVKLFIRITGEWFCKGSQVGQMQIVKENVGDAYKGAITDAIQKCFSLLSIGSDSYRGLLEKVYKGQSPTAKPVAPRPPSRQTPKPAQQQAPPPAEPETRPKADANTTPPSMSEAQGPTPPANQTPSEPQEFPSTPQQPENQDLPEIAGITYQRIEDRVIAVGKVYDKKELLKSAGFKWNGQGKEWFKEATAAIN